MSIMDNRILCRVIVFCVASMSMAGLASASQEPGSLQNFVQSIWGKVVIYIAILLVTTLFLYFKLRVKFAEARAANDLRFMSKHSPAFDWGNVKERVSDCFYRYHAPWRPGDNNDEVRWMSDNYWRDFKALFLERIEKEGLVNVCNIKSIKGIQPLLFIHRNVGGKDEGSKLVVSVTAKLRNYLAAISSGELIEGAKEYQDTRTIWSFEMIEGNWVISNVEDIRASKEYLKLGANLPKIEETLLKPVKVMTATELQKQ